MRYIIVIAAVFFIIFIRFLTDFLISYFEWGGSKIFLCSECGKEFKVSALRIYFSKFRYLEGGINDRNKRILKCPSCNKKCLCVMKDHRV